MKLYILAEPENTELLHALASTMQGRGYTVLNSDIGAFESDAIIALFPLQATSLAILGAALDLKGNAILCATSPDQLPALTQWSETLGVYGIVVVPELVTAWASLRPPGRTLRTLGGVDLQWWKGIARASKATLKGFSQALGIPNRHATRVHVIVALCAWRALHGRSYYEIRRMGAHRLRILGLQSGLGCDVTRANVATLAARLRYWWSDVNQRMETDCPNTANKWMSFEENAKENYVEFPLAYNDSKR